MYLNRESLAKLKKIGLVLLVEFYAITRKCLQTDWRAWDPPQKLCQEMLTIFFPGTDSKYLKFTYFLFFSLAPFANLVFLGKKLSRAATQQNKKMTWIQQTPRSAHADHSLCSPHEEAVGPWLPIICTLKTLIILGSGQMPMLLWVFAGLQVILQNQVSEVGY